MYWNCVFLCAAGGATKCDVGASTEQYCVISSQRMTNRHELLRLLESR